MELTNLPAEIIEALAEYLSVKDVLACSWVNKEWQRAFNNNRIWKTHCTIPLNYFQTQEMKLKLPSENIVTTCKWKENVFNEIFVGKNIRQGNFHVDQINISKMYCDNLRDFVDEAGNHWLVVSCSENINFESDQELQVWNMNKQPVFHTSVKTQFRKEMRIIDSVIKVFKNKILYIYQQKIVYEFAHPHYELKFLYTLTLPHSAVVNETSPILLKNNMIVGFFFPNLHSFRTFAPVVNIWDDTGSLIHQIGEIDPCPPVEKDDPCSTYVLQVRDGGGDKIMMIYTASTFLAHPMVFSMKTFQSKAVNLKKSEYHRRVACGIFNNIIISLYWTNHPETNLFVEITADRLECYDTNERLVFKTLLIDKFCNFNKFVVAEEGNYIAVFGINGTVIVYDIFKQQEVSKFKVKIGSYSSITALRKNLLLLQAVQNLKVNLEIWDFFLGQKLYTIDTMDTSGYIQKYYTFSFIEHFSFPPKIFGIKNPQIQYAHNSEDGEILVISFW